jgi:hypothetical protein
MLLCHCEERLGSWSDAAIPVSIKAKNFHHRDSEDTLPLCRLGTGDRLRAGGDMGGRAVWGEYPIIPGWVNCHSILPRA